MRIIYTFAQSEYLIFVSDRTHLEPLIFRKRDKNRVDIAKLKDEDPLSLYARPSTTHTSPEK